MTIIDDLLRAAIAADHRTLTLPPAFQGLPAAAHGGSVLAAFDALSGLRGAREIRGLYRKRVPLGAALALDVAPGGPGIRWRLRDATDGVLVEGHVRPARDGHRAVATPVPARTPLPVSYSCLACGTRNPAGLRARLHADERSVGARWTPPDSFRAADGGLTPLALTTLLDETAFWLGALASGESGMTTDLRVTLGQALPFGPVVVAGARACVRPRPDDPRYWDTEVVARDEAGRVLAAGRITFVAVRGAARRLVTGMLAMNPPEIVRAAFPAYAR
ncbi:MAG: hypothetical protein HY294_05005 [Candidatus Rokubacteria bacterium]|nr:hypothetical protein [Candidatus Rokubacteria bacterium]MBI3825336.1 hypothetical protein [Candidatus Rokubacteria bacterium]